MVKTASRAPFCMAKLQKLESNGYVNHTVVGQTEMYAWQFEKQKQKNSFFTTPHLPPSYEMYYTNVCNSRRKRKLDFLYVKPYFAEES